MTYQQCQQRVNQLAQQRDSLASEIQYINSQIELTNLKIQDTQQKIIDTQKEIDVLGARISGLDQTLNNLSALMIQKIVESYKQRSISLLSLIFDTKNANDLIDQVKYVNTTRDNDQKLLIQVQATKTNFEEQKVLRDEKKAELNNLQASLNIQQTQLQAQEQTKQNLLNITEAQYESARQELLSLVAFTNKAGEQGLTSFGTGSNGWYYTQRDPRWGNMSLGGSSYSVYEAGCAVTSVAMVCKSYGQNITPADIASDYNNFDYYGNLNNNEFACSGKTTIGINTKFPESDIENYVKNGTPVILKLMFSDGSTHFVVAWGWNGSDFIIHDPFYGPDKAFSERYNWSEVVTTIVIH